jgi:hypothetical protein
MRSIYRQAFFFLLMIAGGRFASAAPVKPAAKIRSVTVTSGSNGIEVEIAASQPVTLRSQVATSPDRLVLDFPDASPGTDLHNQTINNGEVNGIRVGLFAQNPPVTRVVVDLKSPQHYRIYPSGKTVIVRLMSDEQQAAVRAHINAVSYTPIPAKPTPPRMEVEYQNGRLSIRADKVSLAEVLNEVHSKTGTDITIPPGAAQEQVVANIGPIPVREALTALLNGSRFNFIMVGSDGDPTKLKSVILSFRGGGVSQPAIASPEPAATGGVPEPAPQPEMQPQPEMPPQPEVPPQPQEQQAQPEVPQPPDAPPPQ